MRVCLSVWLCECDQHVYANTGTFEGTVQVLDTMYACVHVHTHTCPYTGTHASTYAYTMYVCVHVHTHACPYTGTYEGTLEALDLMYARLSSGAFVIIGDMTLLPVFEHSRIGR